MPEPCRSAFVRSGSTASWCSTPDRRPTRIRGACFESVASEEANSAAAAEHSLRDSWFRHGGASGDAPDTSPALFANNRQDSDGRRYAKPDRQNARSQPGRYEQVTTAFHDVSRGKALPELGRDDRRPHKRKPHLPAMCMAGKRKRDAVWNEGEDIGIMRQQDYRGAIVLHRIECSRNVVRAGPQIADPGDPQRTGWSVASFRGLLHDTNAVSLQGVPHAVVVQPSVMVSQHSEDSGSGTKSLQFRRDVFRRDEMSANHPLDYQVAEDANDVGPRRVGAIDNLVHFGESVERGSDVKIREDRDSQGSVCGPVQADSLFVDSEAPRLEPERPQPHDDNRESSYRQTPSPCSASSRDSHWSGGQTRSVSTIEARSIGGARASTHFDGRSAILLMSSYSFLVVLRFLTVMF